MSESDDPLDDSPEIPYKSLRKIGEHLRPEGAPELSHIDIAGLGTLSLLTTHPNRAFIDLVNSYYINRLEGKDQTDSFRSVFLEIEQGIKETITCIIQVEIPSLRKMHNGRALMGVAIDSILSQAERMLQERLQNPLFDIQVFTGNQFNVSMIQKLLLKYPLGVVAQEMDKGGITLGRDQMFVFSHIPKYGKLRDNALLNLWCQNWILDAHYDFEITAEIKKSDKPRCPLFFSCCLPNRINYEDICKYEPWRLYSSEGPQACAYGLAVSSLLGKSKITV